ncbi:MAG: DUF21 domain-containing protein [Planctomycetes bacterium]|nr:DUF21 domain-containing protein [Planctomycetota bacterium]
MIWWSVVGASAALFLSATFSGMETAVYSLERVRMQVRASCGDRRAARLLGLVRDPARAMCAILVANTTVNYAVAGFCGAIVKDLSEPDMGEIQRELLTTLWVVPVLFIFGEVVPKQLSLAFPAGFAARAWPLYLVCSRILAPVIAPIAALQRRLTGLDPRSQPLLARKGIVDALTAGDEAQALHATQRRMASRVLALRDVTVRHRMVPCDDVASVSAAATRAEVLAAAVRTGRSRLLVDGAEGDRYRGYVNVLDAAFADPPDRWSTSHSVFDLPSVHPAMPVLEAVRVLQDARRPIAQVIEGARAVGILAQADVVDALLMPGESTSTSSQGRG